jgi:hypothetical protein
MLTRKIQLPTVINPSPSASQTSTIQVPPGERVHLVLLKIFAATGTTLPTAGWVGDIRVKRGGKVQRLHSAAELNQLNKVNGAGYGAFTIGSSGTNYGQIIPIFFAEPWRNNNAEADFVAVDTDPANQMEIEVDIATNPGGKASPATVSAQAVVSADKQPRPAGQPFVMKKVFRSDFANSAALDITTLDKRDMYQAIHIVAANVTKAVLKADGLPIHELLTEENDALLTQQQMDPTQYDYSVVLDQDDPMANGLFAGRLSDLQLRVEQSSAATIRVLTERLGPPE